MNRLLHLIDRHALRLSTFLFGHPDLRCARLPHRGAASHLRVAIPKQQGKLAGRCHLCGHPENHGGGSCPYVSIGACRVCLLRHRSGVQCNGEILESYIHQRRERDQRERRKREERWARNDERVEYLMRHGRREP